MEARRRSCGHIAALALLLVAGGFSAFAQDSKQGGPGSGGNPQAEPPIAEAGGGGLRDSPGPSAGSGTRRADAADSIERSLLQFDAWLSSSKEASGLGAVRNRLRAIARPALEAGAPAGAFIARISEAVAKGAADEVIVKALEADASRWTWLAGIVRGTAWPPAASAPDFYVAAAAALRNGLGEEPVRGLAAWASSSGGDPGKAGAALTAAAAISMAFGARFPATAAGAMDDAAVSIARSRLRVRDYPAVAELAVRAGAAGIDAARFMAAVRATIGRGSSLAELEKTLFN